MNVFYILIALAGGAGLSIQAAVNTRLSVGLGGQPLIASFFSFVIGALCLGILSAYLADWPTVASNVGQQAWWRWLGGAIGAAFVFTTVFLAPRIGVTNAMFLFIVGQLTAGMFIDGFGLIQMASRPVYWWKFVGLAVMLAGLVFFIFGDKLFLHK